MPNNVFDYNEDNIEITDYTDLDNSVKTIIVSAVQDTMFIHLAGGNKGQALVKLSNANEDFTWDNIVNNVQYKTVTQDNVPYSGAVVGDVYLEITKNSDITEYLLLVSPSYNNLKNKPIINEDLNSLLFTPTVNTYYRHIGSAGTFIRGGIYFYDGTDYSFIVTKKVLDSQVTILQEQLDTINSKIPSAASSDNKLVDTAAMQTYSMPITTKYGANLSMSFDSSTGDLTIQLKDQNGDDLGSSQTQTIDLASLETAINNILILIPEGTTAPNNMLTNVEYVLDAINNFAAYYITKNVAGDPFDTVTQLRSTTVLYSGGELRTPTRNDYAIVLADENHPQYIAGIYAIYSQWTTTEQYISYYVDYNSAKIEVTLANKDALGIIPGTTIPYTQSIPSTQYSYQGVWAEDGTNGWQFQRYLSTTSLTIAQAAALNSGITQSKVLLYDNHIINKNNPHEVTKAQIGLGNVENIANGNIENGTGDYSIVQKSRSYAQNIASGRGSFAGGGAMIASGEGAFTHGVKSEDSVSESGSALIPFFKHLKDVYNNPGGTFNERNPVSYMRGKLPDGIENAVTDADFSALTLYTGEARGLGSTSLGGSTFGNNSLIAAWSGWNTGFASAVFGNFPINTGNNSIVGGILNYNKGHASFVTGSKNENSGQYAIINGMSNNNLSHYTIMQGTGLKTVTDSGNQFGKLILGKYNTNNKDNVVEIGGGTSDGSRNNLVEITKTGILRSFGTPSGTNDVVRVNELTPVINGLNALSNSKINTSTINTEFFNSLY